MKLYSGCERDLVIALIANKKRRPQLKELIKVIQQEQSAYKDPITEFLYCLYVNYDFDGAQQKLRECEDSSCIWKLHPMVENSDCKCRVVVVAAGVAETMVLSLQNVSGWFWWSCSRSAKCVFGFVQFLVLVVYCYPCDTKFHAIHTSAEKNLRFVYCAAAISSLLNDDWSGMDI
ncbi:hypothetical protein C5167_025009 [Papaver somniferum]|uniref:Uncharacterized protein n=1 Tax=Papaver somniferum TaxID=3469 RepID=A0A4Y7JU03_PAPSO|nr:hypothetical protein C5167_025009 [Papaver somniferum]